jgi:hypothetical protein
MGEGGKMGSWLLVKFFLTWKIIMLTDERVPYNINIPLFHYSMCEAKT